MFFLRLTLKQLMCEVGPRYYSFLWSTLMMIAIRALVDVYVPGFEISIRKGDERKDVGTTVHAHRIPIQSPTTLGAASQDGISNILIESSGGGVLTKERVQSHFH